ncbi:MAG: hypothetical protein HND57_08830 [Planctomycetes bacterium]|nr:hypothetical protein [Planctomycetota bacterium]
MNKTPAHLTTAGLIICGLSHAMAGEPPHINSPILGTIQQTTLTIPGTAFGMPGPDSSLVVAGGDTSFVIPSSAPIISSWTDTEIVVTIDDRARSGNVRIRTVDGTSNAARVEVYAYDWFDIPPTYGTNASPLSIATGADGQVWVNQEFHLEFQHLDPAAGIVEGLAIPKPPDPGPFATTLFSDRRTQMSTLGEDIIVDPQGRVWFTQGGGYLYGGVNPNHSRIVCYDPNNAEYRVYNMPGDWNEIIGIAWDETRERMWVAQGGLEKGPKLASFDPEAIPWDNHFDFSQSLDYQVCDFGEPWEDCYQVYDLPETSFQPAHLLVDHRGLIWYTAYWGNAIGVLHPETGRVIEYPLPEPIGQGDPVWIVGSGPWQIVRAPNNGDIVFCEFFDSTIGRFNIARTLDPDCRTLINNDTENPCIDEWVIPDVDLKNETVHSIAFDPDGRLWYTIHTVKGFAGDASLGFITPDWKHIVRLPPMKDFPANADASGAGVAVDPTTGDVYFCEFWRHRIGRLQRVE